jgi:glycosyltransferase involved in cell wall biosynthesis
MLDTTQTDASLDEPRRSPPRSLCIAMVAACPFPAPRGTPIRINRMAEALACRGHSVDVFTYHVGVAKGDEPFTIHRIARIPTYNKQDPGPDYQKLLIMDPLLTAKLTWALKGQRYDVIHAHHFEGLLAALPGKALFGTPVVFDVHTLLGSELPSYKLGLPKSWLSGIGGFLDARLPPMSDHIIAVSEEIRMHLLERTGLGAEMISMVPNGIEDHFFDHPERPMTGDESPYLVYAGNLAAYQGVDLLLKTFATVRKARPNLRLRMLVGPSLGDYEHAARQLGIRDAIDVSDPEPEQLAAVLAGAAVAANPRGECAGLPQKLLNYMASGCAVVSCAGSAKHVQNGITGLIVVNDDAAAFADAIIRLLDDARFAKQLGEGARMYVRRNLSWDKTAESIEVIYDRLMQKPIPAHERV